MQLFNFEVPTIGQFKCLFFKPVDAQTNCLYVVESAETPVMIASHKQKKRRF